MIMMVMWMKSEGAETGNAKAAWAANFGAPSMPRVLWKLRRGSGRLERRWRLLGGDLHLLEPEQEFYQISAALVRFSGLGFNRATLGSQWRKTGLLFCPMLVHKCSLFYY